MSIKMWNKFMTIMEDVLKSELDSKQVSKIVLELEKRKTPLCKLFSSSSKTVDVKKSKKDPNAPKKWRTSYFTFL